MGFIFYKYGPGVYQRGGGRLFGQSRLLPSCARPPIQSRRVQGSALAKNWTKIYTPAVCFSSTWQVEYSSQLLTVFSSSSYCGFENSAACVLANGRRLRLIRLMKQQQQQTEKRSSRSNYKRRKRILLEEEDEEKGEMRGGGTQSEERIPRNFFSSPVRKWRVEIILTNNGVICAIFSRTVPIPCRWCFCRPSFHWLWCYTVFTDQISPFVVVVIDVRI